MAAAVHEIAVDEAGNFHGTDGKITVTLMGGGRMFKRRAVKGVGSGDSQQICWLVAELDGVYIYQQGNSVIVMKQDILP
ncbi:hypothetical protein [Dokdonella sp.]|uniref:hypothetical protein n=1 Tax=Dokdonella sp. TaxID=2291710 RepID=UPI002DD65299|nr:hypothetical protein [Dokdonella sp.]